MASTWQDIATRKQAERAAKIPKEYLLTKDYAAGRTNVLDVPRKCGLLSSRELHITESFDATALAVEVAAGRLSSVEVAKAFCKRAAIAQQLVRI
jgi:amidase